ncbi:hypothetical protein ES703_90259 [subsurface metagenome]
MSKLKVQPVIHTPSFKRWATTRAAVSQKLEALNLQPLYPGGVHQTYFFTDVDGCSKLLPNLMLKSDLYKPTFTCINYSFKVWNECSKRYGLNTWIPVIGRIPNYTVRHAWNLLLIGDEHGINLDLCLYFEPNSGFGFGEEIELAYQAFPIGGEGYRGEMIFY